MGTECQMLVSFLLFLSVMLALDEAALIAYLRTCLKLGLCICYQRLTIAITLALSILGIPGLCSLVPQGGTRKAITQHARSQLQFAPQNDSGLSESTFT